MLSLTKLTTLLVATSLLSTTVTAAPCVLTNTLGDHAVLQRDRPATIWGFADPGVTVSTTFNDNKYQATTDNNSTWRIVLPATPASMTAYSFSFSCSSGEQLSLSDILFGDVHIW